MQIYNYEAPAAIGILLMFIISGLSKLFSSQVFFFDLDRMTKLGLNANLSYYMLLFVAIGELASSGTIIYDIFDKESRGRLSSTSEKSVLILIAFTVIVTLMFYVFPPKIRPLLSNISTISGLIFVYMIIKRNQIQHESVVKNETIRNVEQMFRCKK